MSRPLALTRWPAALLAVLVAAALSVTLGLGARADAQPTAGPTTEATPTTEPGGWQPFEAADFNSPAGDLCSFAFTSKVLFDAEYVRTPATYPDGSPKRQEYVGPLVVQVTNNETGASVQRDLSGRAVLLYDPDGSYDFRLSGPAAVGFRRGDSLPRGFYVLRGYHVIRFAADGTRTITVDRGTEENLCRTLRKKRG
jgi:hypothetical protein